MTEESDFAFFTYEECEQSWLEIEPDIRRPKYYPKTTSAKDFIYDLKCLYTDTHDEVFLDAFHALSRLKIVTDDGCWSKYFKDYDEICVVESAVELIQYALKDGASERVAFAKAIIP